MTQTGGSQSRRRWTGLGCPKRLRPSRLLGWPKVSRETDSPSGGATTDTPVADSEDTGNADPPEETTAEATVNESGVGEHKLAIPPGESVPMDSQQTAFAEALQSGAEETADPDESPDGAAGADARNSLSTPDAADEPPDARDVMSAAASEEQGGADTERMPDSATPRHAAPSIPEPGVSTATEGSPAGIVAHRGLQDQHGDAEAARRTLRQSPSGGVSPTSDPSEADAPGTVSRETPPSAVRAMPKPAVTRTMVVANQKGGVGKTTTSVNLATALALGGLSVLVIDLDPQANASTALGIDHPRGRPGTYEVLINGDAIADHVEESPEATGLNVLPSTVDLAGAEIELVSVVARENRLKRALTAYLKQHPIDYVLLDCPPSLGLLTVNALVAANEVLIPIQCEYYALEGVSQLVNTIDLVSAELNNELRLSTVLLTMYDARTRLAAQVADEVRAYFTDQTLATLIPRSVRISEAPSYGKTVLTYHPESTGAVSYLDAAGEIAQRGAKENS